MFPAPRNRFQDDRGAISTEYALLVLVGVGFALVLYSVVTSEPVMRALTSLIEDALTVNV